MMFAVPDFCSWLMPDFAQRPRDLRVARKLTQTRLAELLQLSPRVYSRSGSEPRRLGGAQRLASPTKIRNHELHRLYQKVDLLSGEDQKALLVVLDSLVKRSNISRVMAD